MTTRTARRPVFQCAQTVNFICRFHAFLFPFLARFGRATNLFAARIARWRSNSTHDARTHDARTRHSSSRFANFATHAAAKFADGATAPARAAQYDAAFHRQCRPHFGAARPNR